MIVSGQRPKFPSKLSNSKDPNIQTILRIIQQCFEQDAQERPTIQEITNILKKQADSIP